MMFTSGIFTFLINRKKSSSVKSYLFVFTSSRIFGSQTLIYRLPSILKVCVCVTEILVEKCPCPSISQCRERQRDRENFVKEENGEWGHGHPAQALLEHNSLCYTKGYCTHEFRKCIMKAYEEWSKNLATNWMKNEW